ncbi:MAG: hypothetical protein WAK31_02525 [Chthoniobacterales bacterium]
MPYSQYGIYPSCQIAILDALEGPLIALDLTEIHLWVGDLNWAINALETLSEVPGALTYGDLVLPEWNSLRSDPRFQKVLSELKPIPIVNRPEDHNSE